MGKTIEIRIDPEGDVHIETEGFSGGTCLQATKFLESIGRVERQDMKLGAPQKHAENVVVKVGNG